MRLFLLLLSLALCTLGFSQTAKITGKVVNSKTGEILIGANIKVLGTNKGTATDASGTFTISGLAAKTYTISASYVGFSKKEIDEVVVKAGEVVSINISLDESAQGEAVVVKSSARKENTGSLLIAQKNSASVSDGISAEAIKRTPDRNTSDVLKRVSGASIQDDRFVIIRGLNDRYNAAFINGAALPSSESDRKAFAFDIFPSSILDNLVIFKTATPDMSGEFAGGLINITTKSIPTQKSTTLSFGVGYNNLATFKQRQSYKGGKLDFLGVDDGTRAIPSGVPATTAFPSSPDGRSNVAKLFTNNWGLEAKNTLPNFNFQFSQSLVANKSGREYFGALFSLIYTNSNSLNEGERFGYEVDRTGSSGIPPIDRGRFKEQAYNNQTLLGVTANLSLKISDNAKLSWKNIFSINSSDRVITRAGQTDVTSDPDLLNRSNARWFTSSKIYSSQLNGDHYFTKSKFKLAWMGSFGLVDRSIPSLRQMSYGIFPGQTQYQAAIPQGTISNDNAGTMFSSKTNENIINAKVDVSRQWDWSSAITNQVKFGVFYQNRDRKFDARLLGFAKYNISGTTNFDEKFVYYPENQIFDPANMGKQANGKGGFLLLDGTKPFDKYDASSNLFASYVMLDQRINKKLRLIYGVRVEDFQQKLYSLRNIGDTVNINTRKTDVLPSINLVYPLSPKQNLRLSYAKTLNRPEFRELAPFAFFDFVTRYTISGSDTLKRATINNYDLRYEFYPGKSQLFSTSLFYKTFQNPIELVSNPNNDNEAVYQNAVTAKIYGAELEFRSLLSTLFGGTEKSVLQKLTIAGNASVVLSEITLGNFGSISAKDLISKRPLQGQSPYLLNTSLTYANDIKEMSFTASLNRVGERIFIVGTVNDYDIWEKARTVLDLQASKSFNKGKIELKLNARDVLAQKQIFFYDLDNNSKYNPSKDKLFSSLNIGRVISLSVNYKF